MFSKEDIKFNKFRVTDSKCGCLSSWKVERKENYWIWFKINKILLTFLFEFHFLECKVLENVTIKCEKLHNDEWMREREKKACKGKKL